MYTCAHQCKSRSGVIKAKTLEDCFYAATGPEVTTRWWVAVVHPFQNLSNRKLDPLKKNSLTSASFQKYILS